MSQEKSSSATIRSWAALIAALLALCLAAGGQSYAFAAAKINGGSIAKDSIKGKALKAKTITGDKVADNTLTGVQINEASLGQVPSAASAAPSGAAGGDLAGTYPNPTIKPESVGAAEFGLLNDRSASSSPIANGASGSASVQCQAGEQVVSGGNDSSLASGNLIVASRREFPNGWRVFITNNSGSPVTVTVHAYCLAP